MQDLVKKSSGDRQTPLAGQLAYFTTGHQQQRLNYEKVAAMKLPIHVSSTTVLKELKKTRSRSLR